MYLNPLIRSDSIARLGSLYMATIKEKESIVGLLRVACSTSLGVNKATVWKAVLVRKCETLVVFLIRGQSSAGLLLFSYVGRGGGSISWIRSGEFMGNSRRSFTTADD